MRWLLVLVLGVSVACGGTDEETSRPDVVAADQAAVADGSPDARGASAWQVAWDVDGSLGFAHGGRPLFRLTGVRALTFAPAVEMVFGFFDFATTDAGAEARDLATGAGGTVTWEETAAGNLRVTVTLAPAADGTELSFACDTEDRFWGFGEQYNFVDGRGRRVPVWVSEQGVGRAEEPTSPFVGEFTDSYFPMPWFLDPAAGRGFLVENSEYALFDLCAAESDTWTVEVWNGAQVSFLLFPGPEPAAVVSQLTAEVGRPASIPPDWAFGGVWLAGQGGREAVEARLETALAAEIPVTAVWVQDWVGLREFGASNFGVKYHWTWDEVLYPDLPGLIAQFDAQGIRFLGYFNPFVVPDFAQFQPATAAGHLIRQANGQPYLFPIITFEGSLVDLSSGDATAWFQSFAQAAAQMGMAGWMADFGEWLPFDARLASGQAPVFHNLYPTAWHAANRTVLEEARPDGDFVLLTRSGYTGEQAVAQVVWAGDQEADFSPEDGLPTVVTAGLTLGLAGIPFFTHDIAGFSGGPSTKELFMRWTELGAFTPVMRTHDGLKKLENHRFDSDSETLAHFTRFTRVHAALLPVWKALAQEAQATGLPVIRHTVLADPDWAPALDAHHQWMLGPDFVVAPVVTQGADSADVVLPEGDWEHLLTGESFTGRQQLAVPAPLGEPAVFVRTGTWPDVVAAVRLLTPDS